MIFRNYVFRCLTSIFSVRKLFVYCPGIAFLILLSASGSIAQVVRISSIPCYFFRGDKLEVQQTCSYQRLTWAGGGFIILTWEDGVKTNIQYGLQGRGERICPPQGDRPFDSIAVDGVCGRNYRRESGTLRISAQDDVSQKNAEIQCTKVNQNSVCWKRP
jgi:hypothetical protein